MLNTADVEDMIKLDALLLSALCLDKCGIAYYCLNKIEFAHSVKGMCHSFNKTLSFAINL